MMSFPIDIKAPNRQIPINSIDLLTVRGSSFIRCVATAYVSNTSIFITKQVLKIVFINNTV